MGEGEINDQLLERLDAALADDGSEGIAEAVADLVLAAAFGADELEATLGGSPPERPPASGRPVIEPDRIYLESISVQGFRGVADSRDMSFQAGPGVTLVTGRNGSGKSTFAEAAELALTGTTARWHEKPPMWRAGWSNAHHDAARSVKLVLRRDGLAEATTVRLRWAAGSGLDDGVGTAQVAGRPEQPLESLGLAADLDSRRPFLSYDELGSLWGENPSVRHDRMNVLLGLEDWSGVEARLKGAAKELGALATDVTKRAKVLKAEAEAVEDERAGQAAELLGKSKRDLEALEALATGTGEDDVLVAVLRGLRSLVGPDPESVSVAAQAIRQAAAGLAAVEGTQAEEADALAALLAAALDLHPHPDGDTCPVCGTSDRLDAAWHAASTAQVARLRQQAAAFRAAQAEWLAAQRRVRGVVASPPAALGAAVAVDAPVEGLAGLHDQWLAWAELPAEASEWADHLESLAGPLAAAVGRVSLRAAEEHEARQDRWRPVAEALSAWIPDARRASEQKDRVADLKAAAKWVAGAAAEVRAERFAPIAGQVRSVWNELRHESSISVDDLALAGAANQRQLKVRVSVDDIESDAGVALLSQGELHALSLAMFLPRATSDDSPFRFVVIDDPVQAMDGARVDGLARVLHRVGQERQVIVLTHDERLPEAFRSLGLDANVLQVERGERSSVTVKAKRGPAEEALADARAIASTDPYPDDMRRQVVPGLCRQALEAECIDVARRRLLAQGVAFAEVEERIAEVTKTRSYLALALFGDSAQHGEVDARLRRGPFGSKAVGAMLAANAGSHGKGFKGEAHDLVSDTEELITALRSLR